MNRATAMHRHGVFACPTWCEQPDDEHETQTHTGPWLSYLTTTGDQLRARPVVGWDGANDDHYVEMDMATSEFAADPAAFLGSGIEAPAQPGMLLNHHDIAGLGELLGEAERLINDWADHEPPLCGWVWAYDGAEHDLAGVEAQEAG